MKTLIIHPSDPTTDFLKPIYRDMKLGDTTVILGKPSWTYVVEEVQKHDRIICLGHGMYAGLLHLGVELAVSFNTVPYLKDKDCIFVWCFADRFCQNNKLTATATGMIISQQNEAAHFGVECTQDDLNESNRLFTNAIKAGIDAKDRVQMFKSIYAHDTNPVILFNKNNFHQMVNGAYSELDAKKETI